jgi:hypothetical protein
VLVVELQTIKKKSLIIVPVNAHNAGGQLFTGTRRYYVVMMILNTTALWCEHKKGDDLNCN